MNQLTGGRRMAVRVAAGFGIVSAIASLVVHVALGLIVEGIEDFALATAGTCLTLSVVALIGLHRQPKNRSLLVALGGSVFMGMELLGQAVGLPILAAEFGEAISPIATGSWAPADFPVVAQWAMWFTSWTWLPGLVGALLLMYLRFPDGDLPSHRWVALEAVGLLAVVCASVGMAVAWFPGSTIHYTTTSFGGFSGVLYNVGFGLLPVLAVGTTVSLVVRHRHADAVLRHQLRWVSLPMLFGVITAALFVPVGEEILAWVALPLTPIVIAAFGIAVLRYRLFDIDVVLNRALVFGALATIITAVYVGIVVGVGTLLGDQSNLVLAIAATAVVAIIFEPVRARVQHVANVFVYGERATPYEVLAGMTDFQTDVADILPRATALLGEGTGANSVAVFQRVGEQLEAGWTWPEAETHPPVSLREQIVVPGADISRPLIHDAEVVGAIAIAKPRGEPLRPTDIRLVEEFAGQAAVLVANMQLTRQLQARADELAASRRRLVAAQDDARRKLERDVHDGAQQNLVALKVKLGIARSTAVKEGAQDVSTLMETVIADADAAVDSLRNLARGIYPPLLEAEGLGAALRAQARQSGLPVSVVVGEVSRHGRDVEATVYFCVLEALQNVAKHAKASAVRVAVDEHDHALVFTVSDDGHGFDVTGSFGGTGVQGMLDRLDAVGGTLDIMSTPGRGTTVTGTVPLGTLGADDQPAWSDIASSSTEGSKSSLDTNATAPASTAPVS